MLEGKARADHPDRPAASTRVIAEPCVLYRAGAKALSLLFSSIPLSVLALCLLGDTFILVSLSHLSISVPAPPCPPPAPPV